MNEEDPDLIWRTFCQGTGDRVEATWTVGNRNGIIVSGVRLSLKETLAWILSGFTGVVCDLWILQRKHALVSGEW